MSQKVNSKKMSIVDKLSLNLGIVGGGKACKFFLELLDAGWFHDLNINIVGICDINPNAEGFLLAKKKGIPTFSDFRDLFKQKNLDIVIELTGSREVLLQLTKFRPKGLGILEHNVSRLLRNFLMTSDKLRSLEKEKIMEKMAREFFLRETNERILVISPDFSVLDISDSFLEAIGKPKEEVIGSKCYSITHNLNAPCATINPELGCPLVETLRTSESAHVIHEHTLPTGSPHYCEVVTYPMKGPQGKVTQVIEILRDITQEFSSRLEERINDLKEDLGKLIQEDRLISLGKLVASSVHEINNPIQGLITFCSLMEEILEEKEPGPETLQEFKKYLSLMSRELERCGNIISGLLSFARQTDIQVKHIDLNEVLTQVISLTRHKMELQGIQLEVQLHPHPLILSGDLNQLQQCFLNLIFNAMEAMPKGGKITISSRLAPSSNEAVIQVKDSGCGISEKDLPHIFDPFFTTKGEGEGTGLGLSIVYGVVRNHGGEITVESQVGKGTAFTVTFPLDSA